jgi:hypothetical protein
MSTNEKDVVVSANATSNPHVEMALTRLQEVRQSRALIPNFILPLSGKETQKLTAAASVSPQFVEASTSAMVTEKDLGRSSITADEIRDLMNYAAAYGPLADEYEAMGQFLRHSINSARNRAGTEALLTYNNAKRLAKAPRYAGLAVYVADMRRLLGKTRGKATADQLQQRANALAAKAKAAKAKELAAQPADPIQ